VTVVSNRTVFESLTAAQQDALRQAGLAAVPRQLAFLGTLAEEDRELLCRRGLRFVRASGRDLAGLRRAVQPIYDQLERNADTRSSLQRIQTMKRETAAPPTPRPAHPRAPPRPQPTNRQPRSTGSIGPASPASSPREATLGTPSPALGVSIGTCSPSGATHPAGSRRPMCSSRGVGAAERELGHKVRSSTRRALQLRPPLQRLDPVGQAAPTQTTRRVWAATTVVGDLHGHQACPAPDPDPTSSTTDCGCCTAP
jgi:hypothetical protein